MNPRTNGSPFPREFPVAQAIGKFVGGVLLSAFVIAVASFMAAFAVKSFVFACRVVNCTSS